MNNERVDFSFILASSVLDVKNSVSMLMHTLDEFMEKKPPTNSEDSKLFLTLNYEASRINNDLMQLLSIYRLDNNKLLLSIEEHYVYEFLEDELVKHNKLFEMKDIEVSIDSDENLSWYFDNQLLHGVLHNILINTIRYTKDKISLHVDTVEGYLHLTVEDNGDGFPNEMLDGSGAYLNKIDFDTGSTGLGLYFASKVATLHHHGDKTGYISIDNNASIGGAAFHIYLP